MRAENQQLRHELQISEASASSDPNKMESTATLKEVLKQAQVAWSTADAESRFLKLQKTELDKKVILLQSEVDAAAARREAESQREATSASLVQAKLLSVQNEFVTERAKVYELSGELRAVHSELKEWNDQYQFQIHTEESRYDHLPEAKDPTVRRLALRTRTTKKGIGRHRHDNDPGNQDPPERISEIPCRRPAKREEKL